MATKQKKYPTAEKVLFNQMRSEEALKIWSHFFIRNGFFIYKKSIFKLTTCKKLIWTQSVAAFWRCSQWAPLRSLLALGGSGGGISTNPGLRGILCTLSTADTIMWAAASLLVFHITRVWYFCHARSACCLVLRGISIHVNNNYKNVVFERQTRQVTCSVL